LLSCGRQVEAWRSPACSTTVLPAAPPHSVSTAQVQDRGDRAGRQQRGPIHQRSGRHRGQQRAGGAAGVCALPLCSCSHCLLFPRSWAREKKSSRGGCGCVCVAPSALALTVLCIQESSRVWGRKEGKHPLTPATLRQNPCLPPPPPVILCSTMAGGEGSGLQVCGMSEQVLPPPASISGIADSNVQEQLRVLVRFPHHRGPDPMAAGDAHHVPAAGHFLPTTCHHRPTPAA